jgi:hypothetical protein
MDFRSSSLPYRFAGLRGPWKFTGLEDAGPDRFAINIARPPSQPLAGTPVLDFLLSGRGRSVHRWPHPIGVAAREQCPHHSRVLVGQGHRRHVADFSGTLVSLHAVFILLAIGAFGLSAVAALMFLIEEHDLKFHKLRAIFSLLPPIQRLERVMNGLLLCGIALFTAGLALSPFVLKEKYGVWFKGDPLLDYSIFIWLFYLGLLVSRWKFGQGGRRFAWSTAASFTFIILTFWGIYLLSPVHRP